MRTITIKQLLSCYEVIREAVGKEAALKMITSTIEAGVVHVQGVECAEEEPSV